MDDSAQGLVLALSGQVCAGKTTLALTLAATGWQRVTVRELLVGEAAANRDLTREQLQEAGQRLEQDSAGHWIADRVRARRNSANDSLVIDSLRTREQAHACRDAFGAELISLHLEASEKERERRFEARRPHEPIDRCTAFSVVSAHELERRAAECAAEARILIDTTNLTIEETDALARSRIDAIVRGLNEPRGAA